MIDRVTQQGCQELIHCSDGSAYRIVEQIGTTAGSALYRARSLQDGGAALLKLLDRDAMLPEQIDCFRREYKILHELDVAGIIQPGALVEAPRRLAMIAENMAGESLDTILTRQRLDWPDCLRLARQLAHILAALHAKGVTHHDLRPANLLLSPEQKLYLVDVSRATGHAPQVPAADEPSMAEQVHDWAYVSPEQTGRMHRLVDYRTDFYSLGVTLYRMLTGQLPFQGNDALEWMHCHLALAPRPPAELCRTIPPVLSAIVMKLLAKMPEQRYQGAHGLLHDLDTCLAQWETDPTVTSFELGTWDRSGRVQVPQKLFGREAEVRQLLAAHDAMTTSGRAALALVSGAAGIGKSALVQELQRQIGNRRGCFISGKFDQYQRDTPYATVIQALQALVQQILAESETRIDIWRRQILDAVRANGQLIVDVLPQVELVIGVQAPLPQLPAAEARNRFLMTFQQFIGVFAQPAHPLTLFLDDLQWADAASLQLVRELVTFPNQRSLLVVGACRDEDGVEADHMHPTTRMLDAIRRQGTPVTHIALTPLSNGALNLFIEAMLQRERGAAAPLGQLVRQKTGGNPFFAIEFMTELAQEGLIEFDPESRNWCWDLPRINAKGYTKNVADLMVDKLARLPAAAQTVLQCFACLGSSAQEALLVMVCAQPQEDTQAALALAVDAGLLLRADGTIRFLHDRIQETAYLSMPAAARAALHLQIGRILMAGKTQLQIADAVFSIVSQFNHGAECITDASEKVLLCQLNFLAGTKAKAAIAYDSARGYLDRALALLPPDAWQAQYQDAFKLTLTLSECEYLVGNFQRAEQLSHSILGRAHSRCDCARVYQLRMQLYQMAGRYDAALAAMFEAAHLFGVTFPTTGPEIDLAIESEVRDISRALLGRPILDIADAAPLTDADTAMVITLLVEAIAPAYSIRPDYFALITAKAVTLSLRFGNSEDSCLAYSVYGIVLLSRGGTIASALAFSEMALELNRKLDGRRHKGRLLAVHAVTFSPWKTHIADATPMLDRAQAACLEVGDLVYANYIAFCYFWPMLQQGVALDAVSDAARRHAAFARASHNEPICHAIGFQQQFAANLKGRTRGPASFDDDGFDTAQCMAALRTAHFGAGIYTSNIARQFCAFLHGDYAAALAIAQKAALKSNHAGAIMVVDCMHHFYFALTLAALYSQASELERLTFADLLAKELERHRLWAEHCPQNFQNCHALLGAEIARIEGRDSDAERLYEQALGSARDNGFVQNEAIAFELASGFYRGRGFDLIADTYLRAARERYRRWGADGKVAQLDAHHPQLRGEPAALPLDVLSIAKASQAISSQVTLNELADTLLHIVLENAGAQTGSLLLCGKGKLQLAAAADADADRSAIHVHFHGRQAPAEATLPATVLNAVRRSRVQLLLPDMAQPNPFSSDPYFLCHYPKSVLCVPILRQDAVIGLLYLENTLVTHAFAPECLDVLKLLASQAAISLENAELYASLQQENCERKRIEEAMAQLAAIVTSSDDAIIGKTLEGIIVSWNDGAERMYGYSASEMLGRSISILSAPELPDETPHILERLRRGERIECLETVLMRKDGRRIDVFLTVSPIRDRAGNVTGASAIARDISARKRAEQAVRERDVRIRRLVEANIIGVIFWNTGGVITDANDAFLQLSGYSRQDLASGAVRCTDMTPPEYRAACDRAIDEILKTGSCTPYEKEYIRKDGKRVPVLLSGALLEGSDGQGVGFVLDLSATKQAEERVRHMADHDALTGLPNRLLLQDRMNQAIAYAHRNQSRVAILFIDLDYFKNINDSLGHHIGDVVLQMASTRLQKCLREGDSVARLGGDEFVLSLPLLSDSSDAAWVAQKALDTLAQAFIVEGHELHVSASIGISLYPDDGSDVETLMRTADTAMYHAKESGRGNFQFFTAALNLAAQQRLDVGNRLRHALEHDEFVLHYQPQVEMESGTVFSVEALLRWQPKGAAPVSCGAFIANAEESGLIVPIGEWALREACRQLKSWHDAGFQELKMAVNLSPRQLEQGDFCTLVAHILNETGIPAHALELEITESILVQRSEFNLAMLTRLIEMGIELTVDDFGTGYSSLAYLQRFPVHALKIDQSFVRDIGTDPNDSALITAIIAMAASLHRKVIAEGVETRQQADFLIAHGCLAAQGFYFSKAVPAETLAQLLGPNSTLPALARPRFVPCPDAIETTPSPADRRQRNRRTESRNDT